MSPEALIVVIVAVGVAATLSLVVFVLMVR